jgi:DNA-binding transcriptional LysR family regulator
MMMDRFTSLRAFREIVESGSFAGAARRLGLSAPMTSKHIAQLESALGARLLHRSSRRLSLTEAGELYFAQCRQALEILEAADAEVQQGASNPRGQLKISAPVWCANGCFVDVLADYHRLYPDVVLDLRLENRMVDLVAESFDMALRVTLEPSPTLIARKICDVAFVPVVAPAYLDRIEGQKGSGEEAVFGLIAPSYIDFRKILRSQVRRSALSRSDIVMRTDDSHLSYLSVLAGVGYAFLPDWLVGDDIASGRLVKLDTEGFVPTLALHAVYASRRFVPQKLRSFIDYFSKRLGAMTATVPSAGAAK